MMPDDVMLKRTYTWISISKLYRSNAFEISHKYNSERKEKRLYL